MHLFDLLRSDGSIIVNKALAHTIGLNEAIVFSELVSLHQYWMKQDKLTDNEWFFCTIDNLEKNTTLKKDAQNRAIKSLEKLELIESKRMGLPAKRYFRITDKIYEMILHKPYHNQISLNQQTRLTDPRNLDVGKMRKLDVAKPDTNNTRINNTNKKLNNINKEEPDPPIFYNWLEK